jgi:POT family proton-dependent oligopeptide transporter
MISTARHSAGERSSSSLETKCFVYRQTPINTTGMPGGIPYIVGNELAERFSFYGMRSILFAYMTVYLCQADGSADVFSDKEAEAWVHLFVGSAYLFPILGGFISDAFLGKYRTILFLSLVYCLGHGILACMEWVGDTKILLLLGLVLIAVGSGGIKPCVSAHVGDQFGSSNRFLLPKVFGWFYLSINFGAFASGLLTPFLLEAKRTAGSFGETIYPYFQWLVGSKVEGEVIFGHHYAFGLPGILMALATLLFWLGRKEFVHVPPRGRAYFKDLREKENLWALLKLWGIFSFVILFWALFDQIGTLWQVQARELDRMIPKWVPLWGGYELLPAQVSAVFNPLFILLLVPLFSKFIYPLLEQVSVLTPIKKMGIGLWLMVLAFALVSIIEELLIDGHNLHITWQIVACLILTASEVMVSITCLEFAYTQSPKSMKSLVMALFLLTVSLGNYLTSAIKFLLTDTNGQSVLEGAQEFWFWTLLMAGGAILYSFLSPRYKLSES